MAAIHSAVHPVFHGNKPLQASVHLALHQSPHPVNRRHDLLGMGMAWAGARTHPTPLCQVSFQPHSTPIPSLPGCLTVDSLANNLEAIFANTSNDIHTFNPAMGLMLVRAMHNGPTVAGLACLAEGVDVPCHIEDEVSELELSEDTHFAQRSNCASPRAADRELCGPGCGLKVRAQLHARKVHSTKPSKQHLAVPQAG